MRLEHLLVIGFGGAFLTYVLGKVSRKLRDSLAVAVSLILVALVAWLHGKIGQEVFYARFFDIDLILRINTLSWLFSITIVSLGALSIIFSLSYMRGRERTDFYYLMMLLVNTAMLGIALAGDLVSFYIFWEIMSWSTFLLISYNRGRALAAGMKYITMSIIGSLSFLVGILAVYVGLGTLAISEIAPGIASASTGYILFVVTALGVAFGIKNAIMPFHTWLPDAHSEAPSPFSAILSGMLIKMGTYGFLLTFYVIVGAQIFLSTGTAFVGLRSVLCILGAVTIIVPTFIAIRQDDAKRLLAWSTVGQAGYIILGVAFGTNLALVAGVFHFFNHALFKALLFLAVGAVEFRTGTRDLNSLGGLASRMPVVFFGVLVGIGALIGVPLTNGFVSKWLLYKTLILERSPFLAFFALIGTWGAILYSYKLIHNMFLGQLPERHNSVARSPFTMRVPIVVLSAAIILFGVLPGIPLKVINAVSTSFGFRSLDVTLSGIASDTGTLNTMSIFAAVVVAGVVVAAVFRLGRRSVPVAQDDTYAAGAYAPKDRYHYTVRFYDPLVRMLNPYLRDVIDEFYYLLASAVRTLSGGVRHIYHGDLGYYVTYIILFLAGLVLVQMRWSPW